MIIQLRGYQEECIAAHWRYFASSPDGQPLFVVPTGGGKSHIMAAFVRRTLDAWPKTRVLLVTHVKELIEQNYRTVMEHLGAFASVGIYSAGIGRRDVSEQVVLAGIQSIYKKAEVLGSFDLVLVDECHLIPKRGHGRYLTYLAALREINPAVRVLGYTATPYRLDGGWLHRGEDRLFTDVAYEVPIERLIEEGHLSPIRAKRPRAGVIDTRRVASARGDFKRDELESAAIASDVGAAVAEACEIGADRRCWLIFCCGIRHAELVTSALERHGVSCRMVIGETPKDERAQIIEDYCRLRFRALVNVGVLTTGFDAVVDLLVVMRPTQSTGLYVQIYGRGMRIDGSRGMRIGKKDCLALDYGGNVERHGPINRVDPRKLRSCGAAPVKGCPGCHEYVAAAARACPACGHEFPEQKRALWDHDRVASTAQPLQLEAPKTTWMAVGGVTYRTHRKDGRPPSLRVDYICGMRVVSEWVCLEHEGWARRRAERWWLNRAGPGSVPGTVREAYERRRELKEPEEIGVVKDGKYERVVAARGTRSMEADPRSNTPQALRDKQSWESAPF